MNRGRFQQRTFTMTKILISVGILVTIVILGINVLLLIFAGILISILLVTLSELLSSRTRFSRNTSLFFVIFLVLLFLGISSIFFFPSLAKQLDNLREALPKSLETVQDFLYSYEWSRQLLSGFNLDEFSISGGGVISRVTGAASATLNVFANLFIVIFMAIYLSIEPETYIKGFVRLFPLDKRKRVAEVMIETGYALKWWLWGRILAMAIVGILTVIGLLLLSVPMALSLGFIAGVLTFIPNIGPIIAAIPAVLIGLSIDPKTALYVIILYVMVQVIENNLITPFIQKKTVNLPPALALSIQVIGGVLFGFLGLTLSAPLAAAAMVIINMVYIHDTLGDRQTSIY